MLCYNIIKDKENKVNKRRTKMTVVEMVLRTMNYGETRTHYKKSNSNYFLRNDKETYFLEKITKGCSSVVCCGSEAKIEMYVKQNKLKMFQLLHK